MRIILSFVFGIVVCLLSYSVVNASNIFNIQSKSENREISLNCLDQFGFDVLYDPFTLLRNKLFLINIYSNSSAEKADLKIGDEILKINSKKVKNMALDENFNTLTTESDINLEIKSGLKKYNVELSKSNICTTQYSSEADRYFKGIYDNDINEAERVLSYSNRISNKLSKGMRNYIQHQKRNTNYWIIERNKLENAYDLCKSNYQNSVAQHNCVFSAVNKQLVDAQKHNRFFSTLKNASSF